MKFSRVIFVAAALLAAAAGVQAQCPATMTINNVTFNPTFLTGILINQVEIVDSVVNGQLNISVSLCSEQAQTCAGGGNYFISESYPGTSNQFCGPVQFTQLTSFQAVGSVIQATYQDVTGGHVAQVEVFCGGPSAFSSPDNNFMVTSSGDATEYFFTFQSNLFCPPQPIAQGHAVASSESPTSKRKRNVRFAKKQGVRPVRGDEGKLIQRRGSDRRE